MLDVLGLYVNFCNRGCVALWNCMPYLLVSLVRSLVVVLVYEQYNIEGGKSHRIWDYRPLPGPHHRGWGQRYSHVAPLGQSSPNGKLDFFVPCVCLFWTLESNGQGNTGNKCLLEQVYNSGSGSNKTGKIVSSWVLISVSRSRLLLSIVLRSLLKSGECQAEDIQQWIVWLPCIYGKSYAAYWVFTSCGNLKVKEILPVYRSFTKVYK